MSFEDVSKSWAANELKRRDISFTEVVSVYFDIDHSSCFGHDEDDYCYCDTGAWVEVSIDYLATASPKLRSRHSNTYYDLQSLIRELTEWS